MDSYQLNFLTQTLDSHQLTGFVESDNRQLPIVYVFHVYRKKSLSKYIHIIRDLESSAYWMVNDSNAVGNLVLQVL